MGKRKTNLLSLGGEVGQNVKIDINMTTYTYIGYRDNHFIENMSDETIEAYGEYLKKVFITRMNETKELIKLGDQDQTKITISPNRYDDLRKLVRPVQPVFNKHNAFAESVQDDGDDYYDED